MCVCVYIYIYIHTYINNNSILINYFTINVGHKSHRATTETA